MIANVHDSFATRLLTWFDQHGRHDLPWQHPRTPYRVWVSEIMLQQTQVSAVIGYFQRFMQRFPDVTTLASAQSEEVMALWAGLGYYARARNLHQAARVIQAQGMPQDQAGWQALPGVGPSTAAAIVAQAYNQPAVILDGNVKRVMARHAGIAGVVSKQATTRQLWAAAEARASRVQPADYTQAIMDLGATVCRRTQPDCADCPVRSDCYAFKHNCQTQLPERTPKKTIPVRERVFLWLENPQGQVWLEQRPPSGIWGGLYCLPVVHQVDDIAAKLSALPVDLVGARQAVAQFEHRFTHFKLCARVYQQTVSLRADQVCEQSGGFYDPEPLAGAQSPLALPKPISQLFIKRQAELAKLL